MLNPNELFDLVAHFPKEVNYEIQFSESGTAFLNELISDPLAFFLKRKKNTITTLSAPPMHKIRIIGVCSPANSGAVSILLHEPNDGGGNLPWLRKLHYLGITVVHGNFHGVRQDSEIYLYHSMYVWFI